MQRFGLTTERTAPNPTYPHLATALCCLSVVYGRPLSQPIAIFLESWTSLTNYDHIGPREISSTPVSAIEEIHGMTGGRTHHLMTTLATLFAALMMYIPEVGTAVRTTVSAARIIL